MSQRRMGKGEAEVSDEVRSRRTNEREARLDSSSRTYHDRETDRSLRVGDSEGCCKSNELQPHPSVHS